jgi:hypothetical protein
MARKQVKLVERAAARMNMIAVHQGAGPPWKRRPGVMKSGIS